MTAIAYLGLEFFGPKTWTDDENPWTEEETVSLIERVEEMTDTISSTIGNRGWSQVARLSKSKRRFPDACKRKFVELWITYELVVNHGFPMPPSFTERVFHKMTHYSEGDGPIDSEKPKRRISIECVKECVKSPNLLRLLGIETPNELEVVASKGSDLRYGKSTTRKINGTLRGTRARIPEVFSRRKSERLSKKNLVHSPTPSSEGGGNDEEQDGGPALLHKPHLLLRSGPKVYKCYTRKSQEGF